MRRNWKDLVTYGLTIIRFRFFLRDYVISKDIKFLLVCSEMPWTIYILTNSPHLVKK